MQYIRDVRRQRSLQPKGYSGTFSIHHNFVFCYQKGEDFDLANLERTDENNKNYSNPDNDLRGAWRAGDVRNALHRPNLIYPIKTPSGKTISAPEKGWRWSKETIASKIATGEIIFSPDETRIIRKIYLDTLDGRTPETILFGKEVGTTRDAAKEIKNLFDGRVPFDTPKPTALIQHLISLSGVNDNDIVFDFFAGSGTTTQAAWQYNACREKKLRVFLTQLPEMVAPENGEQITACEICDKLGKPRNIAELTKERLRRAGQKIKEENPMFSGDTGFRVFKLDSTNIREWDPDRANLPESLEASVDHLKSGRSDADILYELLLKLGLDLCVPMEQRSIAGKTVHSIGAGVLVTCLDKSIVRADADPLAKGILAWLKELNTAGDTTLVFRDSAFADDVAKTNLSKILEQHGIAAKNIRSI